METNDNEFGDLIRRIREGSNEAARELVERFGDHILRVVRRTMHKSMRSKFDSDDFVQAVWASVFAAPSRNLAFRDAQTLQAFLKAVARNKVVEAVRERLETKKYDVGREGPLEGSDYPSHGPTASQIAMAKEEWQKLLQNQTPMDRSIIEGRADGQTLEAIAETLGVTLRTVRRVMDKLAQRHPQ